MISFSHINHFHTQSSQGRVLPVNSTADKPNKNQTEAEDNTKAVNSNRTTAAGELSDAEKKQLQQLKQRDREVRAHEQAHAAAAGSLANGAPSYDYQRGPDGQQYAVGGSVSIDTSEVSGDPQATLEKAQQIQRAALAPAEPSQQDRAIAAEAAAMAAEARAELAKQNNENGSIDSDQPSNNTAINSDTEADTSIGFCAECGGQHTSQSHTVSTQLENIFSENKSGNSIFKAAA